MPATGKVVGRLVTLIVDKDDPDQDPDLVPLAGKVIFQLNVARVTELNAVPVPMVIASTPFEAVLDQWGYLSTPPAGTAEGYQGVRLPANDDPDLNPTQTQYTVSYQLTVQGTNTQVTIPSHNLFLPSDGIVDLASMVPPVNAPPMTIAQSQALLNMAVRTINSMGPDENGNVYLDLAGGGGEGGNGQSPELRADGGFIQWKYPSEAIWTNLFAIPQDGADGTNGTNGVDGTDGTNGQDGVDGQDGADGGPGPEGKSAYQIAVESGFIGNQAAWLASLKGAAGDKGDKGDDGDPGDIGPAGPTLELRVSGTAIQWRVVGTPTWTDLLPLAGLNVVGWVRGVEIAYNGTVPVGTPEGTWVLERGA